MAAIADLGTLELTKTISEYKWTICNFSSLNESRYKSKVFLINGIKWCIILHVNGIDNKKDHVSVTLCSNLNTTVTCTIAVSNSTERFYKVYNFKHNGTRHVIDKFVQRDILWADLKKDNFNLIIHLTFLSSNETQEAHSHFHLLNDIGSLFKTRENADVTLVSNDDESEHKVHKAILACRSKVFSAMFQHNMKECKDNVVRIEDVDNETLKAMLLFMYTGDLIIPNLGLDLTTKLLIAADKYELDDLKRICINNVHAKLNFDNILDIIIMADAYNINELKVKAKEYFLHNRKEILSTEKRENLKDLPRNIMEDLFFDLAFI